MPDDSNGLLTFLPERLMHDFLRLIFSLHRVPERLPMSIDHHCPARTWIIWCLMHSGQADRFAAFI